MSFLSETLIQKLARRHLIAVLCVNRLLLAQSSADAQPAIDDPPHFAFERYTAASGALYRSTGGNAEYNDSVKAIHVDAKGRVWVGTVTGLAVYDGGHWTTRTFQTKSISKISGTIVGLLDLSDSGPHHFAEGGDSAIWLSGPFGVGGYRDSVYSQVDSSITSCIDMAVDRNGDLLVVEKYRVRRFSGQTWVTVLDPYVVEPKSERSDGFHGVRIDAGGTMWIGGTSGHRMTERRTHEGAAWVVDELRKQRSDGPPQSPLYSFDGKTWRAFCEHDGLEVRWCQPVLDRDKRIRVNTSHGVYVLRGKSWLPLGEKRELFSGRRWVLRETVPGRAELVYRDGASEVHVKPMNAATGTTFDISADQSALLSIAEARDSARVWIGTWHGLYAIWPEKP